MWNDLALALAKFTCKKKRKLGFFFQENIYNGTRIMPLYRCFQRANLDTPHDQHKFCMQFWRMRIDSHAVSHFTELWLHIGCTKMFEHLFQAGMDILNHFFLQNIHVIWWADPRCYPSRILSAFPLCLFSKEAETYKRESVWGKSSVVQTSHLCLPKSSVSPIHL